MSSQLAHVEAQALKDEIEDSWAIEVERRIEDIESGRTQLLPAAEAIARARAAIK